MVIIGLYPNHQPRNCSNHKMNDIHVHETSFYDLSVVKNLDLRSYSTIAFMFCSRIEIIIRYRMKTIIMIEQEYINLDSTINSPLSCNTACCTIQVIVFVRQRTLKTTECHSGLLSVDVACFRISKNTFIM